MHSRQSCNKNGSFYLLVYQVYSFVLVRFGFFIFFSFKLEIRSARRSKANSYQNALCSSILFVVSKREQSCKLDAFSLYCVGCQSFFFPGMMFVSHYPWWKNCFLCNLCVSYFTAIQILSDEVLFFSRSWEHLKGKQDDLKVWWW